MRIAYFDCFSGVAGDMVVGAFIDLGLALSDLAKMLEKLPIKGYRLTARKAARGELVGTDFKVVLPPHEHHHDYGHYQARYSDIRRMIQESGLPPRVKERSQAIFARVAQAEAKLHDVPLEEVRFHEVGAIDSIVDIVGACAAVELYGLEAIHVSEIPLGRGEVRCEHGTLPSPAPATLEILKGVPTYPSGRGHELVTPTGAAIVAELAQSYGPMPPMRIERVGYGAGDDNFEDMPNLLRVVVGEMEGPYQADTAWVIETNIDDMSPQLYENLIERLLKEGALDVSLTPLQMKKNRPGVSLVVLCGEPMKEGLIRTIFQETTAIGLRYHKVNRYKLERREVTLATSFGEIRGKRIQGPDGRVSISPEYDDCLRLARELRIPLTQVFREALRVCLEEERRG